jgi:hypothetical protein
MTVNASSATILGDQPKHHRVLQNARLPLLLSELAPPTPSPARVCCPSPFGSKGGGAHSLAGEGAWGANSDDTAKSEGFTLGVHKCR